MTNRITDPTTRRLLDQIRRGRLECIPVLADHLEERGDTRADNVRRLWEQFGWWCRTIRASPMFRWCRGQPGKPWKALTLEHDIVRLSVGRELGRSWKAWPLTVATARKYGLR
jgi:hypothetical protein